MEVTAESPRDTGLLRFSLQEAEERMKTINRKIQEILTKIANKEDEIALKRSSLNVLKSQNESLRYHVTCRKETLDHLHLLLDKLSFANNAYQQDNAINHSSLVDEEIHYRRLNFKMLHGKKSLQKERQVLREIKTKERKDDDTAGSGSSLEDIHSKIRRLRYMLRCNNVVTAKHGAGEELLRQLKHLEMEKDVKY